VAGRFGTRRVFGLAVFLFTLGSLCCGLSQNLAMLIASRVLQGAGAAIMLPVGRLALLLAFPKSEMLRVMNFVIIPASTLNNSSASRGERRPPEKLAAFFRPRCYSHSHE
jgi:MFS family permease